MNKIHHGSCFSGKMGLGSYIGANSNLNANIGRFCSISKNVICNYGIHPMSSPFATTSPCFYSLNSIHQNGTGFANTQLFNEFKYIDENNKTGINIGNDVWICDGVFINGGIQIANGAVILAHAVVTKNVPPYAIVAGVPAKVIGFRYNEEDIRWLLETHWWTNDKSWFKKNWRLLTNLSELQRYYKDKKQSQDSSVEILK